MATVKLSITKRIINNKTEYTHTTAHVDTEVVNGRVIPVKSETERGVVI